MHMHASSRAAVRDTTAVTREGLQLAVKGITAVSSRTRRLARQRIGLCRPFVLAHTGRLLLAPPPDVCLQSVPRKPFSRRPMCSVRVYCVNK
jgi:hypothetical protein